MTRSVRETALNFTLVQQVWVGTDAVFVDIAQPMMQPQLVTVGESAPLQTYPATIVMLTNEQYFPDDKVYTYIGKANRPAGSYLPPGATAMVDVTAAVCYFFRLIDAPEAES